MIEKSNLMKVGDKGWMFRLSKSGGMIWDFEVYEFEIKRVNKKSYSIKPAKQHTTYTVDFGKFTEFEGYFEKFEDAWNLIRERGVLERYHQTGIKHLTQITDKHPDYEYYTKLTEWFKDMAHVFKQEPDLELLYKTKAKYFDWHNQLCEKMFSRC